MFGLFLLTALFIVHPVHSRIISVMVPDNADVSNENEEQQFARLDKNHDNKLSPDEYLHIELPYVRSKQQEFKQSDTDNDGFLSRSEYDAQLNAEQRDIHERRAQYFGKIFQDYDEDFDMKLSEKEVKKILVERFAVKPRPNFKRIFESFDKNNDGGLDLSGDTYCLLEEFTYSGRYTNFLSRKPQFRAPLFLLWRLEFIQFTGESPGIQPWKFSPYFFHSLGKKYLEACHAGLFLTKNILRSTKTYPLKKWIQLYSPRRSYR